MSDYLRNSIRRARGAPADLRLRPRALFESYVETTLDASEPDARLDVGVPAQRPETPDASPTTGVRGGEVAAQAESAPNAWSEHVVTRVSERTVRHEEIVDREEPFKRGRDTEQPARQLEPRAVPPVPHRPGLLARTPTESRTSAPAAAPELARSSSPENPLAISPLKERVSERAEPRPVHEGERMRPREQRAERRESPIAFSHRRPAPAAAPEVSVLIGRLEVHVGSEAPAKPAATTSRDSRLLAPRAPSLADYLRERPVR